MDDELLLSRAAGGDLESFGQLYDRYFGRVDDFAWRVLQDVDAAAEVTRHVFEQLLRPGASAKRAPSLKAWLFATADRAAVSRAERSRDDGRHLPAHDEAFGGFEVPDPCRVEGIPAAGTDPELA